MNIDIGIRRKLDGRRLDGELLQSHKNADKEKIKKLNIYLQIFKLYSSNRNEQATAIGHLYEAAISDDSFLIFETLIERLGKRPYLEDDVKKYLLFIIKKLCSKRNDKMEVSNEPSS